MPMRNWINKAFAKIYRARYRRLAHILAHPHEAQRQVFDRLIHAGRQTEWGRQFGYGDIADPKTYARRVPVQHYEDLKPWIDRMMLGERDVLWPGEVRWFSKSSGTTSGRSKFIPVSRQNLRQCHIRGSWDTMTFFYNQRADAKQFACKSLLMGGSLAPYEEHPRTMRGDISAIMIKHMPWFARPFFTPDFETALMADFEKKIERMAHITSREPRVVMVGGVPTWSVVLFRRILELTGKRHMLEVWPEFQLYVHGGVSFAPYKKQFREFFPSDQVSYQEVYNASEGYFAAQDQLGTEGMALLLRNGVYYEFIPMSEWGSDNPVTLTLDEVETGKNYALVISTNAGLWRYAIGDTVMFTSLKPYRIKVTGRTRQFINVFGEEVMVENTDKAIEMTCEQTGAVVLEYTVGPVWLEGTSKGGHEWVVEFEKLPPDVEEFARLLDENLQKLNSDYEAKRFHDLALERLRLHVAPPGTFFNWLKARGQFGGQHKVPRLANDRRYLDELIQWLEQTPS